MPLYDYECPHCVILYEINVSIDRSRKPIACEECGKELVKLMSPPRVIRIN